MTPTQKNIILNMNELTLRTTISNNFHNKEIVELCEKQLERLNVESALVENGDISDMG